MASTQQPARRGAWEVSAGDPATVLAEARKALFVMVGFLAVIWIVQLANWADHYQLSQSYGIRPRDAGSLPDLLTAPFLHFSWAHIEGNSGPLFIFGFLAAYRGVTKFFGVTALVILTSGIFDRHAIDLLIGAVMALCFAYQFSVLLPAAGIGWQAHIGGLVGGILAGWVLRERRPKAAAGPSKPPAGPGRKAPASAADGPRADLHKQLDDLGL